MWAKYAHGIPPGIPDNSYFHFLLNFCFMLGVFRLGIFVPLDSRSAARCARAPQLAQSWDYFFGNFFFWLGKLLQCGKYLPALYGRKSIH